MTDTERVDTVVIGGGAMGSATAWQLARRGREVTLLERFGPRHAEGASHGSRRNLNFAYAEPEYLALLVESLRLWRELELETGIDLVERRGLVDHGPGPDFDRVHDALRAAGLRAEFLPLEAARERWDGIRFDTRVLHYPDAGTVRADDAVEALQTAAAAAGAGIRHHARVLGITVRGDDAVEVEAEGPDGDRTVLHARRAVLTAGAWTPGLSRGVVSLPRLTVTEEQPAHFAVLDARAPWPSFNHRRGPDPRYGYWRGPVYGLLDPGEGLKVGWHAAGPVADPNARDRTPQPEVRRALQRYAEEWLPGVDAARSTVISCTYTSTDDGHFVLDRTGPVVTGAGFSGHGFKFTPAIGRLLADLADDDGIRAPALFASTR